MATISSARKDRRVRVTVYLDPDRAAWGKRQEGGLSGLLDRLLDQAQHEQEPAPDRYPPELRAAYHRLIEKRLAGELCPAEEEELAALRERIDALDRESAASRSFTASAAVIDQELADLRRTIQAHPRKTER